jgi:hypothetical protein
VVDLDEQVDTQLVAETIAIESRPGGFVLAFACGCALSSAYGFLAGTWPFGVVEAIWAVIALQRYRVADDRAGWESVYAARTPEKASAPDAVMMEGRLAWCAHNRGGCLRVEAMGLAYVNVDPCVLAHKPLWDEDQTLTTAARDGLAVGYVAAVCLQSDRVRLGAAALAGVQNVDRGHLLDGQVEVEHVNVLSDAAGLCGLGND